MFKPFWTLLLTEINRLFCGSRKRCWQMVARCKRRGFAVGGLSAVMAYLFSLIACSTVLAQPAIAAAQPASVFPLAQVSGSVEALRQQQLTLEQQRSQVSQEKTRLKIQENAVHSNLKGLQSTIKVTTGQIQVSDAQLQTATKTLQDLEVKLSSAEQTYRQKRFSTIARLQFLQRQRLEQGWAVLLQSQSLNDFLDRRYYLKRVYQADRQMLTGFKADSDRLDQQRNLVEQKKNEITLLTQQLMAQKSDMETQVTYQKIAIDRLRSDRRAMETAETQLEQDSHSLASIIQQRLAHETIAFRGSGQMLLPCLGEITSGFGWRMHPVLGYERFHSGIDLGADYGTVIHAAEQGVVIFAGWYGGYGNAVIIDHGGNITTLYGHTSELYVAEGQLVQRGQAIAAVGSTGLSTGPHLHFEVRRDGDPTDPMAFL